MFGDALALTIERPQPVFASCAFASRQGKVEIVPEGPRHPLPWKVKTSTISVDRPGIPGPLLIFRNHGASNIAVRAAERGFRGVFVSLHDRCIARMGWVDVVIDILPIGSAFSDLKDWEHFHGTESNRDVNTLGLTQRGNRFTARVVLREESLLLPFPYNLSTPVHEAGHVVHERAIHPEEGIKDGLAAMLYAMQREPIYDGITNAAENFAHLFQAFFNVPYPCVYAVPDRYCANWVRTHYELMYDMFRTICDPLTRTVVPKVVTIPYPWGVSSPTGSSKAV